MTTKLNSFCRLSSSFFLFFVSISVRGQGCVKDFQEIHDLEAKVVDSVRPRRYIVCPKTTIHIGELDFNNRLRFPEPSNLDGNSINTNPPLPLRPNMNIRCGDDGSKTNNCVITGGHLQVDGTSTRGITESSVDNIIIEGFIFENATKSSFLVDKPGTITLKNCEWRSFTHSSVVPIMMDYYDSFNPSTELVLKFQDCVFRDNQYFGQEAYSTLIFGNSDQNRLILARTTFEDNNMIWKNTKTNTQGFLVETLGPACIDRSCFINNLVGASDIAVFGNSLLSSQIYLSNSSGTVCGFASSFENAEQYRSFKPTCIAAVEDRCNFYLADYMMTSPCENDPTPPTPSVVTVPSDSPAITAGSVVAPTTVSTEGRPPATSIASLPTKAPTINIASSVPTETPEPSMNLRGASTILYTISPIFVDIFLDEPPIPSVFETEKDSKKPLTRPT
eukprot:jgi/Psemu1/205883/e_gw1.392.9.1